MSKRKFKSYLITGIPERDWRLFKRWSAVQDYTNLNDAFANLIRLAGNNKIAEANRISVAGGEVCEQTT